MFRLYLFICLISLSLVSCGYSSAELAPDSNHKLMPSPSATDISTIAPEPTDTPELPTNTPSLHTTDTPTIISLQPTATSIPRDILALPTLTAGQPVTVTHISMIDAENGWAIGHQDRTGDRILYSQDGGLTWDERTPAIPGDFTQNPGQFHVWGYFFDNQNAWVIYLEQNQHPPINAPAVWRTSDGGQHWEPGEHLSLTGGESFFEPEGFSFVDPFHGWLLVHIDAGMSHDYSNLYQTSDGGRTWQRMIDPYEGGLQSLHNTGLAFSDQKLGWVTKDNLAVLPGAFFEQTTDGGKTWENIFIPPPDKLDWFTEISQCATSNPTFPAFQKGILLINCRTFDDHTFTFTYLTSDQGKSWQSAPLPTTAESLFFVNEHIGWALGRDLYQSTDGGLSWVSIKTVNWDGQFSFVDEKTGWAVAVSDDKTALVFTQNSGQTWQLIQPVITQK